MNDNSDHVMTDHELINCAIQFRRGLLCCVPASGNCFALCAALQGFLAAIGFQTKLIESDLG